MHLQVLGIGKLKAGPEKTLADEYRTRLEGLGRKAGITKLSVADFAESQNQNASRRQTEEAMVLAGALAPKAFTLVLDERGKPFTSEGFSQLLQRHLDQGTQDLAFLIG
ncbi:MAG: 23S rRNA (pseudouridine(1915)-N(3))-methyltransferase RlmH, partial [Aestuariivirga sp.]